MKNLLQTLALLFPITVDHLIRRFERDVRKLNAIAANHRAAAEAQTQAAHDLLDDADHQHAEANRAERVAARIASLID